MCSRNYTLFDLVCLRDVPLGCIDIHNLVLLFMVMCWTPFLSLCNRNPANYFEITWGFTQSSVEMIAKFRPLFTSKPVVEVGVSIFRIKCFFKRFRKKLSCRTKVNAHTRLKVKFDQTTVSKLPSKMFSDTKI